MAKIQQFEDLEVWKLARDLAKNIYRITSRGKCATDFSLRDQMRRAAVSILSNIAEGFERSGDKEFIQFLALAKGSSGELRAPLYIASDQQYISPNEFQATRQKTLDVSRMLSGLMKYLRQSDLRGSKYKNTDR